MLRRPHALMTASMRQIENLQGRCADIQRAQEVIQKRLDGYKDMKVGLSPTDKAVLTKLPELIYQQINQESQKGIRGRQRHLSILAKLLGYDNVNHI